MRVSFLVAASLAVSACGDGRDAEPMSDAAAIEAVEASQTVPTQQLVLQPIAFGDIEMAGAFGFSCAFFADGAPEEVLALAMRDMGFVKADGEMQRFAADTGSGETVAGSWRNYDGTAISFTLEIEGEIEGEGELFGPETTRYPASLQIRDANEDVVHDSAGTAECGV